MSREQICASLRRRALAGVRILRLFGGGWRVVEGSGLGVDRQTRADRRE